MRRAVGAERDDKRGAAPSSGATRAAAVAAVSVTSPKGDAKRSAGAAALHAASAVADAASTRP